MHENQKWSVLLKDLAARRAERCYGRPDRFPGPDCPPLPLFDPAFRNRDWTEDELKHMADCGYCQWTQRIVEHPRLPLVTPAWAPAVWKERAAAYTAGQPLFTGAISAEGGFPLSGRLQFFRTEGPDGADQWSLRLRFSLPENRASAGAVDSLDHFNRALFEVQYSRPGLPNVHLHLRVAFDLQGDLVSHRTLLDLDGPPDKFEFQVRWVSHSVENPEAASDLALLHDQPKIGGVVRRLDVPDLAGPKATPGPNLDDLWIDLGEGD
jgi:hypothetical protein